MKPFLTWLVAAVAVFAALGGGYHTYLESSPRRVLVVVDTSYPMRASWQAVAGRLADIQDRRYAQYSLFTEKGRVHGWSDRLRPGDIAPYAPRDLARLGAPGGAQEMADASERLLITNAGSAELPAPDGWEIVRLGP